MRTLILLLLLLPMVSAAERLLIAECQIPADDEYLEAGTRFVMIFQIDSSSESIWWVEDGEIVWYGSDSPDTPFEVNGGIWSISLASDVRKSMRRLQFRFIEGPFPPSISDLSDDPAICAMDYSQIRQYDSGERAKDEKTYPDN